MRIGKAGFGGEQIAVLMLLVLVQVTLAATTGVVVPVVLVTAAESSTVGGLYVLAYQKTSIQGADGVQSLPPATLAEFTLASASGQTFYDISLVDGYNIPLAILSLYSQSDDPNLQDIPPNLTNPICIGTAALLAAEGSTADALLGSDPAHPIPLDQSQSIAEVEMWCPWDLQLNPPTAPGDGVYTYPDSSIQRPAFDPCYSQCAKYGQPADCCTGSYDSPNACQPSLYSRTAKQVCPDAYSYGEQA